MIPELHGEKDPPSSIHSNVDGSLAEKLNVAAMLGVVAAGPESIVVSGGVVSAGVEVAVGGAAVAVAVGVGVSVGVVVAVAVGVGGVSTVQV